jgi:phenylalanyl-tRNA synthetase beta chain
MKVPLSWLAEYTELPSSATPHDVMAELVKVGIEEESSIGGEISGPVVVGQVLEFVDEPQSNGKTIRWCQVRVAPEGKKAADGGADVRGVVCGARNFEVGDKVVVSLPGSVLPGGFAISARKTYGHTSDGMIASSRELGLGEDHSGILVLSSINLDPELGLDAKELLGLNESAAEVNVTPDRGYCFSIRGIAREYSHATGTKFNDPATQVKPLAGEGFDLKVEDSAPIHGTPGCSGFILLAVEGIDAKAATPSWMANRLKLAGMRSISIAVDITNYVMLELGQPLHAYDLDKLSGGITVRRANKGEKITTLDEKVRQLHPEDLLITDGSGPIGIAGVMGGASTEVSDSTTRVLLEAAIFDSISISRSARRHKLPSEASRRFERGVDPEISAFAAARAAQLLEELAGGKTGTLGSNYRNPKPALVIDMETAYPGQLVGLEYSADEVVAALEMVGCAVKKSGSKLSVTVPSWRPDLTHKTDLAEEVARLVGYDKIPATIPVAPPGRGLTRNQKLRRAVLADLCGAGLVEVLNYPFLSEEQNSWFSKETPVLLENALQSEFSQMRKSMLPGLLLAAARNRSRGLGDLALVEEGSVFLPAKGKPVRELPVGNQRPSEKLLGELNASIPEQPRHLAAVFTGNWIDGSPGQAPVEAGYPQALAAVERVAAVLGVKVSVEQRVVDGFHPGRGAELSVSGQRVGVVGELHPDLSDELHLPRRVGIFELNLSLLMSLSPEIVSAREIIAMPAATQDLSLVVGADTAAAEVMAAIREGAGELLENVDLVDDYRGQGIPEGKKSLTFALRFRASDRTLTQAEATSAKEGAVALCAEKFAAEIRA